MTIFNISSTKVGGKTLNQKIGKLFSEIRNAPAPLNWFSAKCRLRCVWVPKQQLRSWLIWPDCQIFSQSDSIEKSVWYGNCIGNNAWSLQKTYGSSSFGRFASTSVDPESSFWRFTPAEAEGVSSTGAFICKFQNIVNNDWKRQKTTVDSIP